jgi:hypothetical protein
MVAQEGTDLEHCCQTESEADAFTKSLWSGELRAVDFRSICPFVTIRYEAHEPFGNDGARGKENRASTLEACCQQ